MRKNFLKNKEGVTVIITLVILGAIIAASVGVASIFVKEIRISGALDDSLFAIIAADAGIEKKLYDIRKLDGDPETEYSATLSNGATYSVCVVEDSCEVNGTTVIESRGDFNGTQRALQIEF